MICMRISEQWEETRHPPFWSNLLTLLSLYTPGVFFFFFFFVSRELSSGRDLVIQMLCGVRRAPSAVHGFLFGAYLGNRMTYLDDIWYVGGARSEVAHAEFWAWQMHIKYLICIIYAKICPEHFSGTVCPTWMIFGMWVGLGSSEVKWGKLCAMATIFGQKPWCKLWMMMTLMEVKGYQRSNGVNYVLWLPYLVKRSADASWEWWWPWWRSKVIRG